MDADDPYYAIGQQVVDELGIGAAGRELVSLVGGGGKTTIMLALGTVLPGAILTTTTKVGADQVPDGFVSLGTRDGKLLGITPAAADALFARVSGHVVVEADGSRMHRVKAPAPHEPVIPSRTTFVIAVMGADAIDRVIEDVAHRPNRLAAVVGCGPYDRLTPARAATLLTSDRGMRKGVPAGARYAVVLTRIAPEQRVLAAAVAALLAPTITCVQIPFQDLG